MNKFRLLKITLATLAVLSLVGMLSLIAVASPTVKVTYKYGDYVHTQFVEADKDFSTLVPTLNKGDIFYGWVDNNGVLYPKGESATVSRDSTLYLVAGREVSYAEELYDAIEAECTYVKLTSSFEVGKELELNRGVFVFDTNGYTLSINSEGNGILGTDTGVVFTGDGKIVHSNTAQSTGPVTHGLVCLSPTTSFNTLFVSVDKDTTVSTNAGFVYISTNISAYDGVFSASVHGKLSCEKLLRTSGISGADFTVYGTAEITSSCEYFFEDIGGYKVDRLVNLSILGGKFNLGRFNGYALDYTKYQAAITGGFFSFDITDCFPDKNYTFSYNEASGYYKFVFCAHNQVYSSGIPSSCTEPATITYTCSYCNSQSTVDFPNGIGHSNVTAVIQPLINTEEKTQAGIYKKYCQKCDENTTYETFYPNPIDTYVTVIILDLKDQEKSIRVPARELYSFDTTDPFYALSFSTEYIQYNYNVTEEKIISVEIPLGTQKVYGDSRNGANTGIFCRNQHLQEIIIPESMVEVQQYAFYHIPKLKSLKGIEHISGTIGTNAFSQNHTNVVIDRMTVNAKTISGNAFNNIRMNSLTIGKNVATIQSGAFRLDSSVTPVQEVFIEGNTSNEQGLTVYAVFHDLLGKTYDSSNQQFGSRGIVYTEHQFKVTVYEPTCYKKGYTHRECLYCSYEMKDSEVPQLTHDFNNIHVLPTCSTQGYTVDKCLNCGDEIANSKIVSEKTDSNAHVYTDESRGALYANLQTFQFFENGSICEDYYYWVRKCTLCAKLNYDDAMLPSAQLLTPSGLHDYDEENKVVIKESNCGEHGIARVTCKTCSKTLDAPLPLSGENHKWDAGTIIKTPTCVDTGIKEFRCTVCTSDSGVRQTNLAKDTKNHDWDEGYVEREPTEMVSGIRRITCKRCTESFTEGINKLTGNEIPLWMIIVAIVGGALLIAGTILTLYFTLFKKKRASDGYKYKFNTLGK